MFRRLTAIAGVLFALLITSDAAAALQFQFEGRYSESEQLKLKTWINEVAASLESLVGPYPFEVQIHFTRKRSGEPVPWAHTQRDGVQGIRFNVDPRHALAVFRRDWTAPHEMSHLILPYLGREQAWFAEGFASYMQHQVMYASGAWSREEITQRYQARLDKAAAAYQYTDRPFVEVVPELRAERKYPTMYWGGAVYFLQLDKALKSNHNTSLIELLSAYMRCCRRDQDDLDNLIAAFDRLIGATVSTDLLEAFRVKKDFPDYGRIEPEVVD